MTAAASPSLDLSGIDVASLTSRPAGKRGGGGTRSTATPPTKESLDMDIAQQQRVLAGKQLERKLLDASPELRDTIIKIKDQQARILDGQRWINNDNGRVDTEIAGLDERITSLQQSLNEMKERVTQLKADKGVTFGQNMIDSAKKELDTLTTLFESQIKADKMDISLDEVMETVG